MNLCVFSGWIPVDPERRLTGDVREVLIFRLMVKSADGEEQQLFFRCDDQAIIARCGDSLTRGRAVYVTAEAKRVPQVRAGVHVTDYITFYVRELEVPNRAKVKQETGDGEQETDAEASQKETKVTKAEATA